MVPSASLAFAAMVTLAGAVKLLLALGAVMATVGAAGAGWAAKGANIDKLTGAETVVKPELSVALAVIE